MTATLFDAALDERRMLRPTYLHAHAFGARIFPDVLDKDAFTALAKTTGEANGEVLVHHAEFGKQQQTNPAHGVDRAWKAFFDVSYADVILEFTCAPLFAWLPAGERFHVVFGDPACIGGRWNIETLAADFYAFVADAGLTAQGKQFLRDACARYMI